MVCAVVFHRSIGSIIRHLQHAFWTDYTTSSNVYGWHQKYLIEYFSISLEIFSWVASQQKQLFNSIIFRIMINCIVTLSSFMKHKYRPLLLRIQGNYSHLQELLKHKYKYQKLFELPFSLKYTSLEQLSKFVHQSLALLSPRHPGGLLPYQRHPQQHLNCPAAGQSKQPGFDKGPMPELRCPEGYSERKWY